MPPIRCCFIGDSITTGTGDATMLGWPGRVCALAAADGHDPTLYNLGVRGDTSEDVRRRWRAEAEARVRPGLDVRLVFAFGLNDSFVLDETGAPRVEPERTIDNARAILHAARLWLPTLAVGPVPVDDSRVPRVPGGLSGRFSNAAIERTSDALAAVAAEVGVPYLDLFAALEHDTEFRAAVQAGDAVHPTPPGYARIAQRVAAWPAWRDWLRAPGE